MGGGRYAWRLQDSRQLGITLWSERPQGSETSSPYKGWGSSEPRAQPQPAAARRLGHRVSAHLAIYHVVSVPTSADWQSKGCALFQGDQYLLRPQLLFYTKRQHPVRLGEGEGRRKKVGLTVEEERSSRRKPRCDSCCDDGKGPRE